MRRNSFFEEFGSIIMYTLLALLVIVLFFVCFAFSRNAATAGTDPNGSVASSDPSDEEGSQADLPSAEEPEATAEQPGEPEVPEETPAAPPEPETVTAENGVVFLVSDETIWALENVKIRVQPSTDAEVLAIFYQGESQTRVGISTDGGWSRIDYDGTIAYVATEYVGTTAP